MTNDKLINSLEAIGCNTKEALKNALGDSDFYLKCLRCFFDDRDVFRLGECLEKGQIKEAFICAHTIKSVSASLGLTKLHETVSEMVEPLRRGESDGVSDKYEFLLRDYQNICYIIENAD